MTGVDRNGATQATATRTRRVRGNVDPSPPSCPTAPDSVTASQWCRGHQLEREGRRRRHEPHKRPSRFQARPPPSCPNHDDPGTAAEKAVLALETLKAGITAPRAREQLPANYAAVPAGTGRGTFRRAAAGLVQGRTGHSTHRSSPPSSSIASPTRSRTTWARLIRGGISYDSIGPARHRRQRSVDPHRLRPARADAALAPAPRAEVRRRAERGRAGTRPEAAAPDPGPQRLAPQALHALEAQDVDVMRAP